MKPNEAVAEARRARGLTRDELAGLAGLAVSTVTRIEEGSEYRTNESVAVLLADALECEVRDLFSPGDLSHLGRPPRTGRPIKATVEVTLYVQCDCGMRCSPGAPDCWNCGADL